MNYEIIKDVPALKAFIKWLPELLPHEKYYISLLARNKYLEDKSLLKADKLNLKRFTADKQYLYNKIKQLEVSYGAYTYGPDNRTVPQEALALYITPNPRNLIKATQNAITELQRKSWSEYDGYNPHSIVLSQIQQANGSIKYFDFDIDGETVENTLPQLEKIINLDCCTFLQTRGGFHILVEISKIADMFEKSWNPQISKIKGCDVKGTNNLIVVPGCVQGDFVPHFVKF